MANKPNIVVADGGRLRIFTFPSMPRDRWVEVLDATRRLNGVTAVGGTYGDDQASLRVYVKTERHWGAVDNQVMAMIQSRLPGVDKVVRVPLQG